MKKVTLIVIASVFSIFILLIAGIYFYASTQISPELVRKVALEQLHKTFPAAKIDLGKVDLSFGTSIGLKLDELNMQLPVKTKKYRLASVKNISAKIPIWAILMGGGTIEVDVRNPALGYYELAKDNNWSLAMRDNKKPTAAVIKEVPSTKKKSESQSISVPALASRFRLNVEVRNVDISYGLKDGTGGDVRLEKFLLKNLNFERPTSFELLSQIDVAPMKGEKASLEVLVIGELNLGELIETQEITCKTMISARKIKLSNFPGEIPEIKTNVVVRIDKKGNIGGSSQTTFSSRNKISSKFNISAQSISVTDLKVELYVLDLLKIAHFKNNMIDANKTKINVFGNVKMTGSRIAQDIKFSMEPGIAFKYQSVAGESTLKGSFKNKSLYISSNTKVLEGNADLIVKHNQIDLSDKKFNPFKLKPFVVDLRVENLKATKKQLQELIYAGGTTSSKGEAGTDQTLALSKANVQNSFGGILLPAANIGIKCARNVIGGSDFGCNGKIKVQAKKITTEVLSFNFSEGRGKVTHTSNLTSKGIMSKFNFDLKNLDMLSLSAMLPPMVDSISGKAQGRVDGGVNYLNDGSLQYDVNVNTRLVNGEIKGMDLAGKINKVVKGLAKLPKVGKKFEKVERLQVGDSFENLELVGRFRHNRYDFKTANFVGLNKKIRISLTKKGKAYIFPPPLKKEGVMDIDFVENYNVVSRKLDEISGSKVVPIRVSGEQFVLTPDVGYTLAKLGKSVVKGAIKNEVSKKVKGKAKKKLDKLFKKLKF